MVTNTRSPRPAFRPKALAVMLAAFATAEGASAIGIDTGNPDLVLRWDNTVRYNVGVRAEKPDQRFIRNPTLDESDNQFDRGDLVTNRLDLLSEADLVWKGAFGVRASGSAWYDQAYSDTDTRPNAALAAAGYGCNYRNCEYNSGTRRYYRGPSAELLDAFVFGKADVGSSILNVRAGKHTVYWGEGLLIAAHALSYSQAPLDGRKSLASPGIETKEVFLPINQVSASLQLTNDLSFAAQYFLDWKPTRLPAAGTYLAASDVLESDRLYLAPNLSVPRIDGLEPKKSGNYGVAMRLSLPRYDAKLGFYYRKFDDYNLWSTEVVPPSATGAGFYRYVYAKDVDLYGISATTVAAGVSIGADLSYRKDAPLVSKAINPLNHEGARGDTWHLVVNAVSALPNSPLWDVGNIAAEVAYNRLDKVTSQSALFRGEGRPGCSSSGAVPVQQNSNYGCATRDYMAVAANITPQYLQVYDGVDLDVPLTVTYSLFGNSPNSGGGNQGEYTWSAGLRFTYQAQHELTLRYADRYQKPIFVNGVASAGNGGSYALNDRGYLSLTYKTSF